MQIFFISFSEIAWFEIYITIILIFLVRNLKASIFWLLLEVFVFNVQRELEYFPLFIEFHLE